MLRNCAWGERYRRKTVRGERRPDENVYEEDYVANWEQWEIFTTGGKIGCEINTDMNSVYAECLL